MQHQGKTAVWGALALWGTIILMAGPVPAQQAGSVPADARSATLLPGAPRWARWTSPAVFLRLTSKWQQMKELAASAAPSLEPSIEQFPDITVSFGQKMFNLDPTIAPQNDTSVVIDPLNVARVVGSYNDYRGLSLPSGDSTGWSITTDGGAAVLKDGQLREAVVAGIQVPSQGGPVLAVDSKGNFFLVSLFFANSTFSPSGIGIARSPAAGAATGLFSAACTSGDGNVNCWPTIKVVAGNTCSGASAPVHDKPYIAVDKSASVAAGSVYVVWTKFGCAASDLSTTILLAKCNNALSTCTAPVTLETTPGTGSFDDFVQFSHITVGPTGKVYVTWVKHAGPSDKDDINTLRMMVITPTALATSVGTLGPLRDVTVESQPIPFGSSPYPALFSTGTYPKVAVMGTRAVVVWDRRTTPNFLYGYYFDSDIRARFTDDDGASFSADQVVSAAFSFQYQPAICVDTKSARVVVSYYSAQNDLVGQHRQDEYVATSPNGAAPYTPIRVTAASNVDEFNPLLGDSFIGSYQEVACGGGIAYVHYTANYTAKNVAPFDSPSLSIHQQDNFLAKVTLP